MLYWQEKQLDINMDETTVNMDIGAIMKKESPKWLTALHDKLCQEPDVNI